MMTQNNNRNLYNSSSLLTQSNESKFLRSILKPFEGPAPIPDDNMTTSHPKEVRLTNNITVPASSSGSVLFVYLPHSASDPIKFFVFVNSVNRYVYVFDIPYDQFLSEGYSFGRFVSGGLSIKSSTTSGTLFNIAGTINAIGFQEIPDVKSLTYNNITAYKRNDLDVVANETVQNGVTALAFPNGSNKFRPFNTDSTMNIDGIIDVTSKQEFDTALWPVNPPANGAIIFDTDGQPSFIPNNAGWGYTEVLAKVSFSTSVGTSNVRVRLTVSGEVVSATDWLTVSNPNDLDETTAGSSTVGAVISVALRVRWTNGIPIKRILITYSTFAPVNVVAVVQKSYLICKYQEYYQEGMNGPGSVIAVQGLGTGQTISLGGVGNFEVVPNSTLAKEITTNYFGPFNPLELQIATHYLANAAENGIKFMWTNKEYNNWLMSGEWKQHVNLEHVATATGFFDFLKGLFKTVKPLVSQALPILGGALLGPGGAMAGTGLSTILDGIDLDAESASYSYNPSAYRR